MNTQVCWEMFLLNIVSQCLTCLTNQDGSACSSSTFGNKSTFAPGFKNTVPYTLHRLHMSKLPFFRYNRDGHQPHSRGLYTHYKVCPLRVG